MGHFYFGIALSYHEQIRHPLWQRKRLEIFNRDDFTCQICGNKNNTLDVHHLYYVPGLLIWEYEDEALKTVCNNHHEMLTYDLPKLSGILAWDILAGKIQIP